MNTQNQIASLASVQDKVRERIQTTFVDLIPNELWEGMVAQQIKEVTENLLPKLAREEAEKCIRIMIQAELEKPEWQPFWDIQSHTLGSRAGAAVKAVVRECSDDLVSALFGRFAQGMINDLRNGIQRF